MPNEMFTQLPSVPSATAGDIICAVQGGVSVQETLQQVLTLAMSNSVLMYPGNPNGNLAGMFGQFCLDTSNLTLFICSMTGTIGTAIWTSVTGTPAFNYILVAGTAVLMLGNNGYVTNNGSLVSLTLPTASSFGDRLNIIGYGAGGFIIEQNAAQQVIIGNKMSTLGNLGSVSSTQIGDSLELVCVVPNAVWMAPFAPQGSLTVV